MNAEPPLLRRLRSRGFTLAKLVAPEGDPASTVLVRAANEEAETALSQLVSEFAAADVSFVEADLERIEDALRAVQARIEGDYDLPALVAVGPLGDKDADIIRIIQGALYEW